MALGQNRNIFFSFLTESSTHFLTSLLFHSSYLKKGINSQRFKTDAIRKTKDENHHTSFYCKLRTSNYATQKRKLNLDGILFCFEVKHKASGPIIAHSPLYSEQKWGLLTNQPTDRRTDGRINHLLHPPIFNVQFLKVFTFFLNHQNSGLRHRNLT